jgi:hypothetical protein
MSLSDLANVATLISSIAVLISLIYLGLQIRQSARNQRSIMDRGRSQQVSEWLQFIASPEIAPLVLRGHACDPTMTPEEHQRYIWCLYPIVLHYEDSFFQYRERMLGEAQYLSICNQMKDSARHAGFREVWSEVRERFPDEFRKFGDEMFAGG